MALKMGKKKVIKPKKIIKRVSVKVVSKVKETEAKPGILLPSGTYVESVGRRKVATARVRIFDKPGEFYVNDMLATEYFARVKNSKQLYTKPLDIADMKDKFTISARVNGSGINSQLEAVVHGLSRALVKFDPELRSIIKQAGLLTRDDRMKETRKIGMGGKARRQRQSPRR